METRISHIATANSGPMSDRAIQYIALFYTRHVWEAGVQGGRFSSILILLECVK